MTLLRRGPFRSHWGKPSAAYGGGPPQLLAARLVTVPAWNEPMPMFLAWLRNLVFRPEISHGFYGKIPNPILCTFHPRHGVPAFVPSRGCDAGARLVLSLATVQRAVSLPPRDAQIVSSLVNQLESPTLEGGSGDAPHSDGRRVLAVAATRRPVKPKVQLLAVDHSAHVSMKSGASSVN